MEFPSQTGTIIFIVLIFNYVHRHYTFPLVYGEREEFRKRPGSYTVLPLAAVLVTAGFVVSGLFHIVTLISILWTMFHSVAQKVGIARVYSRKAGYGDALEYIVFVNIYVHSKYKRRPGYRSLLSRASGNLGLYSTGFAVGILLLCLIFRGANPAAFSMYIVGSSFLHFIYDGWIWKVRKSQVGEPLGIKYGQIGARSETGPAR